MKQLFAACTLIFALFRAFTLSAQQPVDAYDHSGGVLIHKSVYLPDNLKPTELTEDEVRSAAEICRKVLAAAQFPNADKGRMMLKPWVDSLFFKKGTSDFATETMGSGFARIREKVKEINGPTAIMRVEKLSGKASEKVLYRFQIKGPTMLTLPPDQTPKPTAEEVSGWSIVVAAYPDGRFRIENVFGDLKL